MTTIDQIECAACKHVFHQAEVIVFRVDFPPPGHDPHKTCPRCGHKNADHGEVKMQGTTSREAAMARAVRIVMDNVWRDAVMGKAAGPPWEPSENE